MTASLSPESSTTRIRMLGKKNKSAVSSSSTATVHWTKVTQMMVMCAVAMTTILTTTDAIRIDPLQKGLQRQHQEQRRLERIVHDNDKNILMSEEKGGTKKEQERRRTVVVPTDPMDHVVTDLPLLTNFSTAQWAGHLPASPNYPAVDDKYFFYWLFAPEVAVSAEEDGGDSSDTPLIIWLNGGPGCSSMDGLFLENGPFTFVPTTTDDGTESFRLVPTEYSWHKLPAYVVYIDQPVGTGLSFTTSSKYPSNDPEVNADFYAFLQSFFKLHSDKFVSAGNVVNRALYFSGESHSGHYIPSMMNYILKQNQNAATNGKIQIPLSGAAIGNGWVDPYHQYAAAQAAYGHGLIDRAQLNAFNEKEVKCQDSLSKGRYSTNMCFELLDLVLAQSYGESSKYKVSSYDARRSEEKHAARDFPPGHKIVETYLGGWKLIDKNPNAVLSTSLYTQVLEAIHATAATDAGQRYEECTDPPYDALSHQDGLGVVDDVVEVLEWEPPSSSNGNDDADYFSLSKIKLLFFNGIEDLICNHVGNEVMLEQLPWKHQEDWTLATRYAWTASSAAPQTTAYTTDPLPIKTPISGYMKEYENLLFLKILNAGHMVPMDVPNVAFDMMRTLIQPDLSFEQSIQSLERAEDDDSSVSKKNDDDDGDDDDRSSCPVCTECQDCQQVCKEVQTQNDDDTSNKKDEVACPVCDDCSNAADLSLSGGDSKAASSSLQQDPDQDASNNSSLVNGLIGLCAVMGVAIAGMVYRNHRSGYYYLHAAKGSRGLNNDFDLEMRETSAAVHYDSPDDNNNGGFVMTNGNGSTSGSKGRIL